jgi:DNA-binding MarR family transcriptional regulator
VRRTPDVDQGRGVAFLASQVGALSSKLWNDLVEGIGLDSRSAMLLWNVSAAEGRSQRQLAAILGVPPSRVVEMVDELEEKGWLERRIRGRDRRTRELYLTARGRGLVDRIMTLGAAHEAQFTGGLKPAERKALADLLSKLAMARGLIPTAHPDF